MRSLPFSEMVEINPWVKLEKGKEYPFISMGVVEPNRRYVSEAEHRIYNGGGAKFLAGDILFARITPCLENGKIAQYKPEGISTAFGSTEFFIFRSYPSISDPGYIYYLAKSDLIRKPAEKSMSGASGRQRADLSSIKNLKVPAPPLSTQRKIAAILSAYDDLIENNLRRIKILEEMAQALYREWFVHFRFPGHEKVRLVDSPLGKIPEGWEVKNVGVLLSGHIGGGWGKEEKDSKHLYQAHVIRGTDIPQVSLMEIDSCPLRYHSESNLRSRKLKPGDLIYEVSGGGKEVPVGRVLMVTERILNTFPGDVICASFCKRMTPNAKVISPFILFYHLDELHKSERINQYQVQSTGIKNLKFSVLLDNELVIVPPLIIQEYFIKYIEPIKEGQENFALQNILLRRTRDLLLPKLISGEVEVSDLNITIPEEA